MKPHARPMADVRRAQDRRAFFDTLGEVMAVLLMIAAAVMLALAGGYPG